LSRGTDGRCTKTSQTQYVPALTASVTSGRHVIAVQGAPYQQDSQKGLGAL